MNSLIPSFVRKLHLAFRLFNEEKSYLNRTGYLKSKITKSIHDVNGKPVPWMCYPMINFLDERITDELEIFEYGSGMSTLFFSNKAKSVVSVEFDEKWFETVNKMTTKKSNVKVIYSSLEEGYEKEIQKHPINGGYHIIIIDGRKRSECAIHAIESLAESGIIIWDDSDRERYQEGLKFYLDKGFKKLTFSGLKPAGFTLDETSILYRSNNCLGI